MGLKRITTNEGEVYFIDEKTGKRVVTGKEVIKSANSTTADFSIFSNLPQYYQKEFKLIYDSNEEYKGKWNWAAFLFTWIWALTKGAWGTGLLILFVGYPLMLLTFGIAGIIIVIYMGLRGNKLYYDVIKKKNLLYKKKDVSRIVKGDVIPNIKLHDSPNIQPEIRLDAAQEIVLATVARVSDVTWGGFLSLYLTNKRIIVETVMGTGKTVTATLAGGIVGTLIADNIATKKAQKLVAEERSIEQIFNSSPKNYIINYDDISYIILKRKALPIGHSRCKIQSVYKNVTFAFKRDLFEDVSVMLTRILPGKIMIK